MNEDEEFRDVDYMQFFEGDKFVLEVAYKNQFKLREEVCLTEYNQMVDLVGTAKEKLKKRFVQALKLYNEHCISRMYTVKEFLNE